MTSRPVSASDPSAGRVGLTVVRYTGLRMLAFLLCVVVLGAVGLRGLLGILAALLVSSLLSLLLLRRQRDELAVALSARRGNREAERARLRGLLDEAPPPHD